MEKETVREADTTATIEILDAAPGQVIVETDPADLGETERESEGGEDGKGKIVLPAGTAEKEAKTVRSTVISSKLDWLEPGDEILFEKGHGCRIDFNGGLYFSLFDDEIRAVIREG